MQVGNFTTSLRIKKNYTGNKSHILCCDLIFRGHFHPLSSDRWSSCFLGWLSSSELFKHLFIINYYYYFPNSFMFSLSFCVYVIYHDFAAFLIWTTLLVFKVNYFYTVVSKFSVSLKRAFTGSLCFLFQSCLPGLPVQYFQAASRLLAGLWEY